jgi:hypothetical protein
MLPSVSITMTMEEAQLLRHAISIAIEDGSLGSRKAEDATHALSLRLAEAMKKSAIRKLVLNRGCAAS